MTKSKQRHRSRIGGRNSVGESDAEGIFRAMALSWSARDPCCTQHRIGGQPFEPGQCPLSVQVFMALMQKIHRLTDN
jgi:hypothetical protein